jgi:hypothetical protein
MRAYQLSELIKIGLAELLKIAHFCENSLKHRTEILDKTSFRLISRQVRYRLPSISDKPTDPAIPKARELFKASGKKLDEVGLAMGFKPEVARKSVWQLLNKIDDPKLSTLRKFATAMGVPMSEFFPEIKKGRSK